MIEVSSADSDEFSFLADSDCITVRMSELIL